MNSALVDLYERQGQSPWLGFIRRDMLEDGGLRRYVEEKADSRRQLVKTP